MTKEWWQKRIEAERKKQNMKKRKKESKYETQIKNESLKEYKE